MTGLLVSAGIFAFGTWFGYIVRAQDGVTFFQRAKNYFDLRHTPKD